MRFIVLAAMLALLGSAAHAQTPVALDMATVSMTPAGVARMVTNTICVTDGNDLVCDRGAYVLPGGLISTTNISTSALTVNGVPINGDPGHIMKYMGSDQPAAIGATMPFTQTLSLGGNGISQFGNQITLSPGSSYFLIVNIRCYADSYDNRAADYQIYDVTSSNHIGSSGSCSPNRTGYSDVPAIAVVSPVISRTYEVRTIGWSGGSPAVYVGSYSTFTAFRLGGGINAAGGGSATAAGTTGQLQYNTGNAFDASAGLTWTNASSVLGVAGTVSTTSITVGGLTLQQIMASATTAQGDRITSGTASGVVAMAGGTVSFTTGGTSGTAYLDTFGRFIGPGVSATGTVSSSKVATNDVKLSQVGGQCSQTEDYGRFFRNPTTGRFQLCMPRP